jgi:CheY-like chemotaxis protein
MCQFENSFSKIEAVERMAKLVIMVIDQTEEILKLFEEILGDEGYKVSLHYLSQQSLQEVKQLLPDLIISDHSFDDENLGWQFLQKLKMDKQTRNIPVIVCSTNMQIMQDAEGRLFNMGIRVLPKPFLIDDLLSLVEQLIGKARPL